MHRVISDKLLRHAASDNSYSILMSYGFSSGLQGANDIDRLSMPRCVMEKGTSHWEAAEIVPGADSCAISQRLAGHRFLIASAPELPLSGCTSNHCTCRYEYFPDRRHSPRRAEEQGKFAMLLSGPETERRNRRGRRDSDK